MHQRFATLRLGILLFILAGLFTPVAATAAQSGDDADAYLADVSDQADAWAESLERFDEIDPLALGLSEDEIEEVLAIVDDFAAAPDTAAGFEAPEDFEDVQAAFEDLAGGYADVADTFNAWLETESGSAEEADAEDIFIEALDAIPDLEDELDAAIEDAGSGGSSNDDNGSNDDDSGSADADAGQYLEDVTAQAEAWAESYAFVEDAGFFSGETIAEEDLEGINAAFTEFVAAPDTAAEFEAPEGMEDVQAAFEDLAGGYGEIGDAVMAWLEAEEGSTEQEDAGAQLIDAWGTIPGLQDDFDAAIEDAGASSGDADEDERSNDDEDSNDRGSNDEDEENQGGDDAETAAYLEEVRAHTDELLGAYTRYIEILTEEGITEANQGELGEILTLWAEAPEVAAAMDVPAGMEDIQADYEEMADAFALVTASFVAWGETEAGSAASESAWTDMVAALTNAVAIGETFNATLAEAGA